MNLAAQLREITRPLRVKLGRWLSSQDRLSAAEKGREVGELRAEVERLRAETEQATARLCETAARLTACDTARREAEAALATSRPLTWDKVLELARGLQMGSNWEAAARVVNAVVDQLVRPFHKRVSWGDRLLTIDKSFGTADDPTFRAALDTFRGVHPYDQYNGPDSISWRLNTLVWAGRTAAALPGDFVECGVFKGDMAYTVARCLGFETLPRTFHLYDSFEGYSPKYSSPADFPHNPNFLETANAAYRIPGLYDSVRTRFAPYPNVKVVRGFLPDALDPGAHPAVAFLHIDLNSPAAEIGCLEALFDRLVPGGIVVLDDYGWIDFAPQKRAEDEFFARRGYHVLELPTGQGMVVKR